MTQCGEKTSTNLEVTRHVNVRVSLFYDGTGNNRTNTEARLANAAAYRMYGSYTNSYSNDHRNVSRQESPKWWF